MMRSLTWRNAVVCREEQGFVNVGLVLVSEAWSCQWFLAEVYLSVFARRK